MLAVPCVVTLFTTQETCTTLKIKVLYWDSEFLHFHFAGLGDVM